MDKVGFIGLGVMGEPMCRNLARKSGASVFAFDLRAEPLARLAAHGVTAADSLVLRNHGMKSLLPGAFPERAFPTDYMRKDSGLALPLPRDGPLRGTRS